MVFKKVKPDPTFETWDAFDKWLSAKYSFLARSKQPRRRKELREEIGRVREAHKHLTRPCSSDS